MRDWERYLGTQYPNDEAGYQRALDSATLSPDAYLAYRGVRQRAHDPNPLPDPSPEPSPADPAPEPITAPTAEVRRLEQLVDVLQTELEARRREVEQLHIVLSQQARALDLPTPRRCPRRPPLRLGRRLCRIAPRGGSSSATA